MIRDLGRETLVETCVALSAELFVGMASTSTTQFKMRREGILDFRKLQIASFYIVLLPNVYYHSIIDII